MTDQQEQHWRGIGKLVEEMGEVQQLLGKALAFPVGDHPDGLGPIRDRLPKELADAAASIDYFMAVNGLEYLEDRYDDKFAKFHKWGLPGVHDMQAKPYGKETAP